MIEEGVIPGALSSLLPEVFAGMDAIMGEDTDRGLKDFLLESARELGGLFRGRESGALRNTQTYLVMSHDDGQGRMRLEDDRLRISWPDVGEQSIFRTVNERLRQATAALGGHFDENPLWTRLFGHDLVTVHPLGGCVMADDAGGGVVNDRGQVFSGATGDGVYESLYVMDGAVIPRPIGVNPLLTISAVAERSVALLARDHGWPVDYDFEEPPVVAAGAPARLGVEFTETMRGAFAMREAAGEPTREDYERAAAEGVRIARAGHDAARMQGRPATTADFPGGGAFEFTLTITSSDLDAMIGDPDHAATMVGTVRASTLSPDPLMVTNGRFNLFLDDPTNERRKRMRYQMDLSSEDGTAYTFEGFKEIADDRGVDVWTDTTTLYVTIREAGRVDGRVGLGILRISPKDFMRQLTTMRAIGARGVLEAAEAKVRFGRLFAGELQEVYGALLV